MLEQRDLEKQTDKTVLDSKFASKKEVATPTLCRTIVKYAMNAAIKTVWPIQVEGIENLPKEGPYILGSNHEKLTDPLFFGYLLSPVQLHFLAKVELFQNPALGWLLKQLDAIPVDRKKPKLSTFREVNKVLQDDGIVAIFPDGVRRKYITPNDKPKNGAGYFAVKNNVPLVPASISYNEQLTVMRFGEPIPPESSMEELNAHLNIEIQRLLGRACLAANS